MDMYSIQVSNNGYVIRRFVGHLEVGTWVARSWAEVVELLQTIGAPDFVTETNDR